MLFLKFKVELDKTKEIITVIRGNDMRLRIGDKINTMQGEGTIIKILI